MRIWLAALTVPVLVLLPSGSSPTPSPTAGTADSSASPEPMVQQQPNILVISLDDATRQDARFMPHVQQLLYDKGFHFSRSYSTTPLCCPARSSMLTGRYAHNHGVLSNQGDHGGFQAFDDQRTVATMLDQQEYSTAFIGKYLNGYNDFRYVPQGWDRWKVPYDGVYNYTESSLSVNGSQRHVRSNMTRWYAQQSRKFVQTRAGEPWFLYLSFVAPHDGLPHEVGDTPGVKTPWVQPSDRGTYQGPLRSTSPAFNEDHICDKRRMICNLLRLKPQRLRTLGEIVSQRRESLQLVDRQIEQLVETLRSTGQLNETYIFFVSDNGFLTGEHRLMWGELPLRAGGTYHSTGKSSAYEPAALVPFVVRGPDVPAGQGSSELVGLIDMAPTIAGLAGVGDQPDFDGVDLLAQMEAGQPPTRLLVLESFEAKAESEDGENYTGIVTSNGWKLVRYGPGVHELYRLNDDPHELRNLDGKPRYHDTQRRLTSLLRRYRDCVGEDCRS